MSDKSTTPRPWRLHDMEAFTVVAGKPGIAICLADAISRDAEENEANTALIVRAVNQYDHVAELVEAAKEVCDQTRGSMYRTLDATHGDHEGIKVAAMNRLRSALAKF